MIFNNAVWAIFIAVLIVVILYVMFHKRNEGVVVNIPDQRPTDSQTFVDKSGFEGGNRETEFDIQLLADR